MQHAAKWIKVRVRPYCIEVSSWLCTWNPPSLQEAYEYINRLVEDEKRRGDTVTVEWDE